MFDEESLLKNFREADEGYRMEGISGTLYIKLIVKYFGEVKYSSDELANITCKARVFAIAVDDAFRTEPIHVSDAVKFVFRVKYGGLHVCEGGALFFVDIFLSLFEIVPQLFRSFCSLEFFSEFF